MVTHYAEEHEAFGGAAVQELVSAVRAHCGSLGTRPKLVVSRRRNYAVQTEYNLVTSRAFEAPLCESAAVRGHFSSSSVRPISRSRTDAEG
jgi:hypothetical protein